MYLIYYEIMANYIHIHHIYQKVNVEESAFARFDQYACVWIWYSPFHDLKSLHSSTCWYYWRNRYCCCRHNAVMQSLLETWSIRLFSPKYHSWSSMRISRKN